MRCMTHSERSSIGACPDCGREYCAECFVDINGGMICKNCVAILASRRHIRPEAGGAYGPGAHSKTHNKFLLFCLSILPGAGYMYLGLMKRGIFTMGALFASIFLTDVVSGYFGFVIGLIAVVSFFDGFNILRKMRAGINVSDGIEDVVSFVKKHKFVFLVVLVVLAASEILSGIMSSLGNILPLLLIAAGVYFLFFRKKGSFKKKDIKHEDIDNNEN